ncbi:MAG: hypothetical protein KDD48_06825 [Bdellovibrionales bacterium]|nr:hypothetical protein [Bdellovibrionales bacterium]
MIEKKEHKPEHKNENNKATPTMSERIKTKWSRLSDGDIRTIGKDMSILANKVSTVYGRSKTDVEKEIATFQNANSK